MEACLRDDVDLPPKQLLQGVFEVHLVEEVDPAPEANQKIEVARGCGLPPSDGTEHPYVASPEPAGDPENLASSATDYFCDSEPCPWAQHAGDLRAIPSFGLAAGADAHDRLGRAPRVGTSKTSEDGNLNDLHAHPATQLRGDPTHKSTLR